MSTATLQDSRIDSLLSHVRINSNNFRTVSPMLKLYKKTWLAQRTKLNSKNSMSSDGLSYSLCSRGTQTAKCLLPAGSTWFEKIRSSSFRFRFETRSGRVLYTSRKFVGVSHLFESHQVLPWTDRATGVLFASGLKQPITDPSYLIIKSF